MIVSRGEKAIVDAAKRERLARRTGKKKDAWPDARRQRRQIESEVWANLRDALLALTSLPLPSDVAQIARANDRTNLVTQRLPQSIEWLEEFANEWRTIRDQSAA